jgi:lactate racemase
MAGKSTHRLPYGSEVVRVTVDRGRLLGVLDVADTPALADPAAAIHHALANPIGLDRAVWDLVSPGETVALIVSDQFRQTRADQVLPVLVDVLNEVGVPDEDMRIVFATGTHRSPTDEEAEAILGAEIYARFRSRILRHDAHDPKLHVNMGATSRGTPVFIDRQARDCDRIISTGAVVMHYFGGFGGGRKSIVPGLASVETISKNHALNLHATEDRLDPAVRIGALDGNPVAEDMLEAAQLVGVDAIVNTVLNRDSRIAGVFAGELDAAHRAAAAFARDLFAVPIEEPADLVIAATATTRNYVQSHKALFNAYQALRPGGRIVLLAPCPEGLGGEHFVKWARLGDRASIIAGLRVQSEINGQTALSTVEKAPHAYMITEMSEADVSLLGARKCASAAAAVAAALDDLASRGIPEPTYYVMPSAAYSVPILEMDSAVP